MAGSLILVETTKYQANNKQAFASHGTLNAQLYERQSRNKKCILFEYKRIYHEIIIKCSHCIFAAYFKAYRRYTHPFPMAPFAGFIMKVFPFFLIFLLLWAYDWNAA